MDAFHISPTLGVEAITGLISIYLYLQKLSGRYEIKTATLPSNHAININLESRHSKNVSSHCLSLENITSICYGTLNTNNFLFYFILFFLILLYFFFILFFWRDDGEGT